MAPLHKSRAINIRAGSKELAHWQLLPGKYHRCTSPPFRLPAGLQELTIESRGSGRPADSRAVEPREDKPYSVRVARVSLYTEPDTESFFQP
jgi:hypothetical protein